MEEEFKLFKEPHKFKVKPYGKIVRDRQVKDRIDSVHTQRFRYYPFKYNPKVVLDITLLD